MKTKKNELLNLKNLKTTYSQILRLSKPNLN